MKNMKIKTHLLKTKKERKEISNKMKNIGKRVDLNQLDDRYHTNFLNQKLNQLVKTQSNQEEEVQKEDSLNIIKERMNF